MNGGNMVEAGQADRAVWTRVGAVQGAPLDLLTARFGRRHYAPHIHDEFAIGVCTDGVEVIRYRGERHFSGIGSILVIEPGEPHTGGPAIADGMAYRALYPAGALLAADGGDHAHFRSPVIDDGGLADEFYRAHLALSRGEDPLEGETRLVSWLATLVRRHATPARSDPALRGLHGSGDTARLARAVTERLADRMTEPPTLTEIGADLGLSRYQVLRAFRDAMGMPPYAWLAQHRVNRARCYLEQGLRPAEAAALTGFADQAHLTRWFRRVVGVTPGVFRNSVQDPGPRAPQAGSAGAGPGAPGREVLRRRAGASPCWRVP